MANKGEDSDGLSDFVDDLIDFVAFERDQQKKESPDYVANATDGIPENGAEGEVSANSAVVPSRESLAGCSSVSVIGASDPTEEENHEEIPDSGPNATDGLQQQQQLSSSDHNNNMVFTHSTSVPPPPPPPPTSAVTSPLEPAKRKRGRPRKYGTPEQALAAKNAATKEQQQQQHGGGGVPASPSFSGSTKKSQLSAIGNSGQGFTPHVLNVVAGEDVGHKIMGFMRQCKRDICIMSASGSISNASIRQPATPGGNVTYEGHFEIISLSGSYVHTNGGKSGGLSVCLSNTNGQIIGGGVGGPLTAAGPVQIIVGTFLIDNKNDMSTGAKVEVSIPRLPSPVGGAPMMNVGFRSTVNSSGRNMVRANDEQQQAFGGSNFMIQGMHGSADWRAGPDARSTGAYDMAGRGGRVANQSPENGDYDQIQD